MAFNNLIDLERLNQFFSKLKLLLNEKVDKEAGKGLSTNDFTDAEKSKLNLIEAEATKTIVDSALSSASTNPVQNKVITDKLDEIETAADEAVIISDTQPTSENNKIWVDDDNDSAVQIATYAELQALETTVAGKVTAVAGKGLSTNDYTDSEKTKLAGIAVGAQVNTITGIKGEAESLYRTGNVNISKENLGLGNVEDKSSADIRGELTKKNVTDALGYTPPETDTSYEAMTETEAKTGTATEGKLISAATLDAAIENKGYTGNVGTITEVKMNGASKGTSGVIDLGTVITEHQDISGKLDAALKGKPNGVAELDSEGKVPASQLPSYVDDVIEYNGQSAFPATGESGKIYLDTATNKTYRWSGSAYVFVASDLALGETAATAFRGDYGAAAYAHGVTNKGAAFAEGFYKVTTNAEGHVTSATAVVKKDITDLGIPGENTTYEDATTAVHGLMSATDKIKLNGIEDEANKTIVDSALSAASENPVQNKVIKSAIDAIDDELIVSDTQPTTANNRLWVSETNGSGIAIATQADLLTLEAEVNTKVTAEAGKGLSSNDFTDTEKAKLAAVGAGAQVNVIETIKKNGAALTVAGKAVDIAVPTKTSDLTNDSSFVVDASYVHTDNNFTSAEKTKLANLDADGEANVIESVKVNGSALTVTNKAVDVTVPTKTSEITNDSNFAVDASYVHTDNNYTTNEKNKLAGIEAQANKTVVDSALSSSSENPVQNRAVTDALSQLESEVVVSDTQPTATTNQVWINETTGVGIPMATYAELQALEARVLALEAKVAALESGS